MHTAIYQSVLLQPISGGYPEYYILQYSEQNNNLSTVQVATLYHTITDLQPVTQYIVNVASYNLNGKSYFSEDYTFGTFGIKRSVVCHSCGYNTLQAECQLKVQQMVSQENI